MYCVIRACPTSPSLESFSSDGTTTCSNCRMIDAVMYGMIPSAKIAIRPSAAAGEQVEQAEDAVAAELLLDRGLTAVAS